MGKNRSTRGKNSLVRYINLDEGFTAIKAQENKSNKRERERERERETHTYTLTQSYMRIYALMQYYGKLQ